MYLGKKASHDWNGEPILYAQGEDLNLYGVFFAVWALLCDLEHGYSCYDLPNPTSNACCPCCPVGLEANLMWWDFRPAAAWIDHIYSVQSWLARGLNASYMGAYI